MIFDYVKKLLLELYKKHKKAYSRKWFFVSFISAYALWMFSVTFMFESGNYAESVPYTPSLHDLIVDNVPTIDMNQLSTLGIEWAIKLTYILTLVFLPSLLPSMLRAFALFKIFRGFFISLLHMGPPFGMIPDGYNGIVAAKHYLTKDLFFSGHTGYIFLSVFIFWNIKLLRYFFLIFSIVIGSTTLFMHDHYSIDVLAAFPITFCVYYVSKELFKSDWLAARDPNYDEPNFLSLSPYKKGCEHFDKNCL